MSKNFTSHPVKSHLTKPNKLNSNFSGKRKKFSPTRFIKTRQTVSAIRLSEKLECEGKLPSLVVHSTASMLAERKPFKDRKNIHAPLNYKGKELVSFEKLLKEEGYDTSINSFLTWYEKDCELNDLIKSYAMTVAVGVDNTYLPLSFSIRPSLKTIKASIKQKSHTPQDYIARQIKKILKELNLSAWFVVELDYLDYKEQAEEIKNNNHKLHPQDLKRLINKTVDEEISITSPTYSAFHIHGVVENNTNLIPLLKQTLLDMGYEDGIFKKNHAINFKSVYAPFGISEYAFKHATRTRMHAGSFKLYTNSNDEQSLFGGARGAYNDVIIPRLKEVTD